MFCKPNVLPSSSVKQAYQIKLFSASRCSTPDCFTPDDGSRFFLRYVACVWIRATCLEYNTSLTNPYRTDTKWKAGSLYQTSSKTRNNNINLLSGVVLNMLNMFKFRSVKHGALISHWQLTQRPPTGTAELYQLSSSHTVQCSDPLKTNSIVNYI
jgi:hypothetical protein